MGYYDDTTNMIFSSAQALTSGSADSTNVIDTAWNSAGGADGTPLLKDLGIRPMVLRLIVTTAFAAAGNGGSEFTSLTVSLKSDSTTNMDTSETIHAERTILLAALTAGAEFAIALPLGQTYERYLGIEYTVNGGENPTAGAVTAILVPAVSSMQYFADGSSIKAG
jgi:hypothetical protein